MAHLLLHLPWPRSASEKIWRTSSLVVVISPIGPCSDPGDELTMTAHCAPSSDMLMMIMTSLLFIVILLEGNLMTMYIIHCIKVGAPLMGVVYCLWEWALTLCGWCGCGSHCGWCKFQDQRRSILMFARNWTFAIIINFSSTVTTVTHLRVLWTSLPGENN